VAGADGGGPAAPRALAELQRLFFELVTAPEGVARELQKRDLPAARVEAAIAGDARASAVERLDVYGHMYFFRILDVLRGDYPKVLAVVGDDAFHNLTTDYLQAHPSRHPSLRFAGAALPGVVRDHGLAGQRPWLAELAALEWARVDVFDRADAAPLAREAVAALPPDGFASLALRPVPAVALVPAAFLVEETWRGVEHGGEAAAPGRAPEDHALLVWRRGVTVHHRPVAGRERRALGALTSGAISTFGALCAALTDGTLDRLDDDQAASAAVGLLGAWLADEILAAS
jgi:hypothetical protein